MTKRLLSFLLMFQVLLSILTPVTAFAAEQYADVYIEYYINGKLDEDFCYVMEDMKVGDSIVDVSDKTGMIYELDRIETLPHSVKPSNNVIKVYYQSPVEHNFKIQYYFDGILDTSKTERGVADIGEVINVYTDYSSSRYIFDKVENYPMTIKSNSDKNVMKVYYNVVYPVRTEYVYFNYYYDNVLDNTAFEVKSYRVGRTVTKYEDKVKPGFTFDRVENLPLTVSSSGDNVVNIYYKHIPLVRDYTIEYYYNNVKNDSKTEKLSAMENTIINSYPDKAGDDYVLDKTENFPLTVSYKGNNTIKVYYKDKPVVTPPEEDKPIDKPVVEDPKPEKLFYTVEYYYDGELDDSKTDSFNVVEGTLVKTYKDKRIENFELDKVENKPLTVKKGADNTIRVYYKTIRIVYSIEYYYDRVIDSSLTETYEADKDSLISTYTNNIKEGYKFSHVQNFPLRLDSEVDNVIKVYYVSIPKEDKPEDPKPDDTKPVEPENKITYTVEYYFDNKLNKALTDTFETQLGQLICGFEDKVIEGYELDDVKNMPLSISEDGDNTIRVYYKKTSIVSPIIDDEGNTSNLPLYIIGGIAATCMIFFIIFLWKKKREDQ